jgi:hypothetical protein
MPISTIALRLVALAVAAALVAAGILHLDLSLPVSSMNGQWQIQDWFDHPQATAETRREYMEDRRQYPRTLVVKPFGHAVVGSRSDCNWTQHVVGWPDLTPVTDVWATTIFCKGMAPIRLWAAPHNVYTHARSVSGLRQYYSDMNDDRIEVMFQLAGTTTYIDYIPASWPKADTSRTTKETAINGPSASSNNRLERARAASSVSQGGSR